MATTFTTAVSLSSPTGSITGLSGTDSETGNTAAVSQQLSFPANSNAASFTLNFNAAGVQALFFVATQNCTITTNNSTSPTNTISLVAGIPLQWGRSPGYFPQPLNANTNAGFLTCNASTILSFGVLTS